MEWVVIVPAVVALAAAVFSTIMAARAHKADTDAARLRELESPLSDKKRDLYEPLLEAMGAILTPEAVRPKGSNVEQSLLDASLRFMRLAPAYASR